MGLLPGRFHHAEWQVCGLVHRENFVFAGKAPHLKRVAGHIAIKYKIKVPATEPEEQAVFCPLNRSIQSETRGIVYESDHREARR